MILLCDLHCTNGDKYLKFKIGAILLILLLVTVDRISIGLRSDGTVVAAGDNSEGACDVGTWTDIRLPM